MRAKWETEKQAISEVKGTKQQIEEVKHQMEEAERNYYLEKLAQLKYGTLPELEKKLTEEKEQASAGDGDRLLKEEVTEEEIGRSHLGLDRHTGKQTRRKRERKTSEAA